jgi:TolA-binding protein
VKLAVAGLLVASLGGAPFQCGSSSKEFPREESAGDAIYNLAMDFRAKGNEPAAKDALRYLVQHYPSNRHAPAARAEIEGGDAPATSAAPAAK